MLWISAAIIGVKPARSIRSMRLARSGHPGGLSTQGALPKLFQSPSTLPAARPDDLHAVASDDIRQEEVESAVFTFGQKHGCNVEFTRREQPVKPIHR